MLINCKSFFTKIEKLFLLLYFYSIIGWLYEILYETFIHRWKFMPREFLREPICPIYGIGGVMLFLMFYKIINSKKINFFIKILIIFCGTVIVSSFIEYISSYVLEITTGSWPWQGYSNYVLNLNGRISLPTSIKFGVLGIVFLLILYQPINRFFCLIERKKLLHLLVIVLFVIFIFDILFAIIYPTNIKLNVVRERF